MNWLIWVGIGIEVRFQEYEDEYGYIGCRVSASSLLSPTSRRVKLDRMRDREERQPWTHLMMTSVWSIR